MSGSDYEKSINGTDTGDPDIRKERALAEENLYPHLAEVFTDKSLVERITGVREYIFGRYGDVKGDSVTRVRDRDVYSKGFIFIPPEEVGARFFPALVKRIDALYDYVLDQNQDEQGNQFDRLVRFSSIVYSLGVTLHPYVDANGQTFRITALSYLSEILDENFRLPKGSKIKRSVPENLIDNLPKNVPVGDDTVGRIRDTVYGRLAASLKEIVQLRRKSPTYIEAIGDENCTERLLQLDRSDELQINGVREELVQGHPEWTEHIDYILEVLQVFPETEFHSISEIYNYPFVLDIQGFDSVITDVFTYSREEQVQELRAYLQEILEAPMGYTALIEFIDTGTIENSNSVATRALLAVLNNVASQIYQSLEY